MPDQETIEEVVEQKTGEPGAAESTKGAAAGAGDAVDATAPDAGESPGAAAGESASGAGSEGKEPASDPGDAADDTGVYETPPNGAPYDFTRPWTLSNKFNQNLTSIGEAFANQLSFTFSNYLRTTVDVAFRSIKQELYRDHLDALSDNVVMGVVTLPPLHGQSLLSVESSLMFVVMEKLIGGAGKPFDSDRDLTEIEMRIFHTVISRMLGDLKEAARKYFVAEGTVSRIETNPSFASVMTPSEKTMTLKLQVTVNEVEGAVQVTIPLIGFDPVMDSLDPRDEATMARAEIPAEDREAIRSALADSAVEVAAVLGSAPITLDRLLSLEVNDTIALEHRVGEPVAVKAGSVTICHGEPGKSQNRKAIRLVTGVSTEVVQ